MLLLGLLVFSSDLIMMTAVIAVSTWQVNSFVVHICDCMSRTKIKSPNTKRYNMYTVCGHTVVDVHSKPEPHLMYTLQDAA